MGDCIFLRDLGAANNAVNAGFGPRLSAGRAWCHHGENKICLSFHFSVPACSFLLLSDTVLPDRSFLLLESLSHFSCRLLDATMPSRGVFLLFVSHGDSALIVLSSATCLCSACLSLCFLFLLLSVSHLVFCSHVASQARTSATCPRP